ncbi:hypothetical protein MP638_003777 [Amoeboaphelidium occidentale]|nr:hypothetical protein MP638_003777 [Amoeboaphelidium occidentale]
MTLCRLPDELLTCIFEKVGKEDVSDLLALSRVSHRFNSVAMPVLYRDPEVNRDRQFRKLLQLLQESKGPCSLYPYHEMIKRFKFGNFLCRKLNDEMVSEFVEHCKESLRGLTINSCKYLTGASVRTFANCSKLEEVALYEDTLRPSFDQASLTILFTSCKNLSEITLFHCSYVDDETVDSLATNCKELRKLVLINVGPRFTDDGVKILKQKATRLRSIFITSKTLSESEDLVSMAKRCEKVYICVNFTKPLMQEYGMKVQIQSKLVKNVAHEELEIERTEIASRNVSDALFSF